MSDEKAPKSKREFEEEIHDLAEGLNHAHKELHALNERIDLLEKEMAQAGFTRVEIALRDVYANITQAGQALVKAHMNLNIPPGA